VLRATESMRGRRRYLDGREHLRMSRRWEMCHSNVVGMLKKKIFYFSILKMVLEASLKFDSMVGSSTTSLAMGVFRSNISSTNWLWETTDWNP